MAPFKVIVIGGGLSGCLLARGLNQHNIDVTVYERENESESNNKSDRSGYQIRLGEYGFRAFRYCLDPTSVASIEQKFGVSFMENMQTPYSAPSIYPAKVFRPIVDLGKLPTWSLSTTINRVVLREFLIGPLRQNGTVKFGKHFSHYDIVQDPDSGEQVRVHFVDGTSDTCNILIGADGSGSKVSVNSISMAVINGRQINKQLGLCNIIPIDSHWAFSTKGTLSLDKVKKLPPRLKSGPILAFHKGFALFYSRKYHGTML